MWCVVQNFRSLFCVGVAALAVCLFPNLAVPALGSDSKADTQNPDALVREVLRNEIQAQLNDKSLWCYRQEEQEDGRPSKAVEVCQTTDGDLERVVAVNGRELDAPQVRGEDEPIHALFAHPGELRANPREMLVVAHPRYSQLAPF